MVTPTLANVFTKATRDRWRGMTIGAVVVALFLLMGMAVYRDIDLDVYTSLPEVFRSLVGIAEDADVGSLAYGAIYGFYGAITLASIALAMGSASIAGEERNGTMGILLGNPRSRTEVLASKVASMVLLSAFGAAILWGAGYVVPEILSVDVSGMQIGALMFHIFVNALFYGFLAMAIGGWTGSRGLASGVAAGVMVVSFFAAGLLPLIEGWESAAKAFPWYYYDGSRPVINGISWGHISVLLAGCVAFAVVAFVGVNRRDIRGQSVGVTILDRLRANPITTRVMERLAGGTRVSRMWIKTASDHQGLLLVTAAVMFLMCLMLGPMYNAIDDALARLDFPDEIYALAGAQSGNINTPEGWFEVEIFGLMAPIAVMVVTVVIGAKALAGEEGDRTMGLLLANPIKRRRVVLEKAWTMLIFAIAAGLATFAGVALGVLLAGLDMNFGYLAAACALATLLGLVFGAMALALGAATGRVKVAVLTTVGAALAFHVVNSFGIVDDTIRAIAEWTPFYYYLTSDPLNSGLDWGHAGVLAASAAFLVVAAVWAFDRRDLRQVG